MVVVLSRNSIIHRVNIMFKSKYLALYLFIPMLGISSLTHAAVMAVTDNGSLLGFTGLSFLGSTWDVEFVAGRSIRDVFGVPNQFDFDSEADALEASAQLDDAFILFPSRDADPSTTEGCDSYPGHTSCNILTPWALDGANSDWAKYAGLQNNPAGYINQVYLSSGHLDRVVNSGIKINQTIADWTKVATVPVPAAIWLLGAGLLGLLGVSHRKVQ